jgi:signal transduction histidine kinase
MSGLFVSVSAMALSWLLGYSLLSPVAVSVQIGCLGSIFLTWHRHDRGQFEWWPLYLGLWLSSVLMIGATGGVQSPFLDYYVVLYVILGLFTRPRVGVVSLLAFVAVNLALWALIGDARALFSGSALLPETHLLHNARLLLVPIVFCLILLSWSEGRVSREVVRAARRLTDLRLRSARALEESVTKGAILRNVSHELRTPLGALTGMADLACDPHTSDEEREALLSAIGRNGQRLGEAIRALVELSDLEADLATFPRETVDVGSVVERAVGTYARPAAAKGLALRVNDGGGSARSRTMAWCDARALTRIVEILLDNAIKFTPRGHVQVVIDAAQGDPPCPVEIRVSDTGIGMRACDRERIFERFTQGKSGLSRDFQGLGLGLPVARLLARKMGGDVVLASSQVGSGSTFAVTMPRGR